MSDTEDPTVTDIGSSSDHKKEFIAVELSGKDKAVWIQRCKRFYDRILNSVRKLHKSDIPPMAKSDSEVRTVSDLLAKTAGAAIRGPLLKNLERQAALRLKVAEAREKEAIARKTELEADKLEFSFEAERNRVLASQHFLDLAIQRGEIVVLEHEGETVIGIIKVPNSLK